MQSLGLDLSPPAKKTKTSTRHGPEIGAQMDATTYMYKRNLKQLWKEESKAIKNKSAIKVLVRETTSNRKRWIAMDRPSLEVVVQVFPSLREYDYVSSDVFSEFCVRAVLNAASTHLCLSVHG